MRDVTDNRTTELPVGETKRGRGRPRKANALTNAERQAAYRARHRNAVTVTKKPGAFRGEVMHQDVGDLEDAMAELRAELDATKAELAEAHETIDDMTRQTSPVGDAQRMATLNALVTEKNDEIDALEDELELVRSGSRAVREQLELAEAERNKAFKDNARLDSELRDWQRKYAVLEKAAMTVAPKSVTRNGNPVDFDFMVQVVNRVRSARDWRKRSELFDLDGWKRFNCSAATTEEMRLAFQDAITGDSNSRMMRNAKERDAQERNEKS